MADNVDEINVDNAWNKLHKRLADNGLLTKTVNLEERYSSRFFLRIAAAVLIVAGLGAAALYIGSSGIFTGNSVVVTGIDNRSMEVSLPDGSHVWLNRNSELSYKNSPGKATRNVKLKGEAFFDIAHNASKPFIIDAGKAKVKVLGTSFNVITSNPRDEVEVFVKTGSVMLSDQAGSHKIILEPGYVGKISSASASKSVNENQNYLSWKTDLLVYNGEILGNVFSDLKKVHNINVVADDPAILTETISTTFDKLPQDTIISIICTTFNLRYQKEGQLYHLSRK
jgi:ferric-dicitrate binding protein FerR (iron transport regulator)